MHCQEDPIDRSSMAEALALAGRPARRPWPNPPVGALVVQGREVVGRGTHNGPGTSHAEVAALEQAGTRARGATLYCTLEPCNHQGRTPPCAPAIARSGIARLVASIADPNETVGGGGFDLIRRAGIAVTTGVLADEALELIWPFAASDAFARPFVLLKTATSLDGFFGASPADPNRSGSSRPAGTAGATPLEPSGTPAGPRYLTDREARQQVHRMRRWADLVLVGPRTIAIDRPRLDTRLAGDESGGPASPPLPAYVDAGLALEPPWPGRPHVVFTGRTPPPAAADRVRASGGHLVTCDLRNGRVLPESILAACHRLGWHVILLEGGPTLAGSFLGSGLVDRWVTFTAPRVLGRGVGWPDGQLARPVAPSFTLTRLACLGADAMAVWDRANFPRALASLAAGHRGR